MWGGGKGRQGVSERGVVLWSQHRRSVTSDEFHVTHDYNQGTHISWRLEGGDGVEDHVKAARQNACIVWFTRHGIGLARVGDAVSEEKPITAPEQALNQGQGHTVVHLSLASCLVEDMLEGVLGLYTQTNTSVRMRRVNTCV